MVGMGGKEVKVREKLQGPPYGSILLRGAGISGRYTREGVGGAQEGMQELSHHRRLAGEGWGRSCWREEWEWGKEGEGRGLSRRARHLWAVSLVFHRVGMGRSCACSLATAITVVEFIQPVVHFFWWQCLSV